MGNFKPRGDCKHRPSLLNSQPTLSLHGGPGHIHWPLFPTPTWPGRGTQDMAPQCPPQSPWAWGQVATVNVQRGPLRSPAGPGVAPAAPAATASTATAASPGPGSRSPALLAILLNPRAWDPQEWHGEPRLILH